MPSVVRTYSQQGRPVSLTWISHWAKPGCGDPLLDGYRPAWPFQHVLDQGHPPVILDWRTDIFEVREWSSVW